MSPLYAPVIVAVPVALGVNVTEHVPAVKLQLVGLNVPAVPVDVNDTVPVGVLAVPGDVSVTVAVQVEPWPMATGDVHDTAVAVALRLTVTLVLPLLAPWLASPP